MIIATLAQFVIDNCQTGIGIANNLLSHLEYIQPVARSKALPAKSQIKQHKFGDLVLTNRNLLPGVERTLMTLTRFSELSEFELVPYWLGTPLRLRAPC